MQEHLNRAIVELNNAIGECEDIEVANILEDIAIELEHFIEDEEEAEDE
jgi:hypothetical protein